MRRAGIEDPDPEMMYLGELSQKEENILQTMRLAYFVNTVNHRAKKEIKDLLGTEMERQVQAIKEIHDEGKEMLEGNGVRLLTAKAEFPEEVFAQSGRRAIKG